MIHIDETEIHEYKGEPVRFTNRITKIGSSLGILIPTQVMDFEGLREGDYAIIWIENVRMFQKFVKPITRTGTGFSINIPFKIVRFNNLKRKDVVNIYIKKIELRGDLGEAIAYIPSRGDNTFCKFVRDGKDIRS